MLYKESLYEAEEVFKALSTPMRLKIMELIHDEDLSMNDLAERLNLTNSAISLHVKQLEKAGLVTIRSTSGKRGTMKIVKPSYSRLIVDLYPKSKPRHCYQDEISIGHFTSSDIHPTCGLANSDTIIGELDSPKVFSYPERYSAEIMWLGYGSISYTLPNRLTAGQKLEELQISFEISSECPGTNEDYPSDIYFGINGTSLGKWVSPGDFGARKGILSPSWWNDKLNQYGLLKTLIINHEGTFVDGSQRISKTTVDDLNIDYNSSISFTFSVPKDTTNCGGLTLFGSTFGDYNQGIKVKAYYENT